SLHGEALDSYFSADCAAGAGPDSCRCDSAFIRLTMGLASIHFGFAFLLHNGAAGVWSVPWSFEPAIIVPLVALLVVYAAGAIRRGNFTLLRWRHASFTAG